jgi:tetratricopeptide (TPR) repeat protein
MTESQASILEKAKRGEPEAITDLLNRKLQPKGITAKTSVKNNCFWIMLEAENTPSQKQLVEFVRQAFTNLEVYAYATVKIYGKCLKEDIPDWHEDISITTKVFFTKSPEFTPLPVKAKEANGYVLSNEIYDLINETCFQSLERRDNLEGSIHDIARNYIEDLESDLRLDFDQFTIEVINLVRTFKVQIESNKIRDLMSQVSTYEFNVVKSTIRDLDNLTGVILSTDFPESDELKNIFQEIIDNLTNNLNNKSTQGAVIGSNIGSLFDPVVGSAIGTFVGGLIGGHIKGKDIEEILIRYEKVTSKLISEWELFLKKVFRKLTTLIAEETSLRFLTYEVIEKSIELFNEGFNCTTDEINPNLQKALNFFDRATTLNSGHYQTWDFKGFTLSKLKRYEEAIKSYDKALEIKPDLHFAWDNRGDALGNLGRKEEAILSYDKALEIKPEWHFAWNNRGNALISLGRNEEAIDSFGKVFQLNPDDPEIWDNLGIKFSNLGKYKEALAAFDNVLQFKFDDYTTWILRGNVLLNLERNEEAITSYDRALEIKPDDRHVFYNKACAYSLHNQIELALKNLQKAIQLNPEEYRKTAKTESSFDNIRHDPRFQALIQ